MVVGPPPGDGSRNSFLCRGAVGVIGVTWSSISSFVNSPADVVVVVLTFVQEPAAVVPHTSSSPGVDSLVILFVLKRDLGSIE